MTIQKSLWPERPLNSNTLAARLAAQKNGLLTPDETVRLYQYLIDDNMVWGMGHAWVEMAEFLISQGYCLLPADVAERLGFEARRCSLGMATIQYPDPADTDPFYPSP